MEGAGAEGQIRYQVQVYWGDHEKTDELVYDQLPEAEAVATWLNAESDKKAYGVMMWVRRVRGIDESTWKRIYRWDPAKWVVRAPRPRNFW